MSAIEQDRTETEGRESGLLRRTFQAEFQAGEGRTLDVRIVPYGVTAEVSDGGPTYREMWMPGAFADQVRGAQAGRARQVYVNYRHRQGIQDVLGNGTMLREASDGFYGTFELHDTPEGDKALTLVRNGVLTGVSLEAFAKKTVKAANGVVQRAKGHLVNIALCPTPAYETAGVLAVREELIVDEELLPPPPDRDLLERCRQLGIPLPEGMATLLDSDTEDEPDTDS